MSPMVKTLPDLSALEDVSFRKLEKLIPNASASFNRPSTPFSVQKSRFFLRDEIKNVLSKQAHRLIYTSAIAPLEDDPDDVRDTKDKALLVLLGKSSRKRAQMYVLASDDEAQFIDSNETAFLQFADVMTHVMHECEILTTDRAIAFVQERVHKSVHLLEKQIEGLTRLRSLATQEKPCISGD